MRPSTDLRVYPVLLAGGSGSRLWPVSRELHPKQIAKLIGKDSLIQSTLRRLVPPFDMPNVRIVCGEPHRHEIARHMEEMAIPAEGKIIAEPIGRNTAPAILLAALRIRESVEDAILTVFPADHVIADVPAFHARLAVAVDLARAGSVVTFGITPQYAETGYGYVEGGAPVPQGGGALAIRRFVEKPDPETARRYLDAGNFFWNSGMFAFRASVILDEFRRHQPQMLAGLAAICVPGREIDRGGYGAIADLSIDVAVMEKTDRGVVLPSEFGWSDIGSWKSLYAFLPKDAGENVLDGDVIARETRRCLILGYDRLIAANRLQDLVVVETPDSIFVSDIDHSRDVKSIVSELKRRGRSEYQQHLTVHHPWGARTLLEENDRQRVYRLALLPRAETAVALATGWGGHWFVLEGRGRVRNGRRRSQLAPGRSFTAAGGEIHLANAGEGRLSLIGVETVRAEAPSVSTS